MCQKGRRRCPELLEHRDAAVAEWSRAEDLRSVRVAWGRLGGLTTLHRYGPEHYRRLRRRRAG